jgi:hypothetical protein
MPTMLSKLYHRDMGFPKGHPMPQPCVRLSYSKHAREAALERLPRALDKTAARELLNALPERLPSSFEVIEVSTFGGMPAHWLVRFPLHVLVGSSNAQGIKLMHLERTDYDVVLALGTGMVSPLTVRTVYLNHKDDNHATLRRERYQEVR